MSINFIIMWQLQLIILLMLAISARSRPEVKTKFGQIRGKWMKSLSNKMIDAYLGLPYAKPPTDELRFKSPQNWTEKWEDVKDFVENRPTCIQIDEKGKVTGSEDCLYLNIFVSTNTTKPAEDKNATNSAEDKNPSKPAEETSTNKPAQETSTNKPAGDKNPSKPGEDKDTSKPGEDKNETKKNATIPKLPVLVFIRGGSFNMGTTNSSIFSPIYLLNEKIILVTFNYRLNFLGFYSTGNKASPGNYGLKDMVAVLRWVKDNIADFGGDPESVTIFGNSAGAAAVHYLSLSKKTKGLFHKMITMSGSALAPWAFHPKKNIKKDSMRLAEMAGCLKSKSSINDAEIVDCMRNKDAKELLQLTKNFAVWGNSPSTIFGPTLEDDSEDAVVTIHPRKAIEASAYQDIPWILGVVADEGLGLSAGLGEANIKELTDNFNKLGPYLMECHQTVQKKEEFTQSLIDYYFQGNISRNFKTNFTKMLGDVAITWPTYEALKIQGLKMNSSVFFYNFTYEGTFSVTFGNGKSRLPGVAHMDDLNYLFPFLNNMYKHLHLNNTPDDLTMIHLMTEMWTSFAKDGEPSAQMVWTDWYPYQDNKKIMRFGEGLSTKISMQSDLLENRTEFLETLMKNVSFPLEELAEGSAAIETLSPDSASINNNNNIILFCLTFFTLLRFI